MEQPIATAPVLKKVRLNRELSKVVKSTNGQTVVFIQQEYGLKRKLGDYMNFMLTYPTDKTYCELRSNLLTITRTT